MAANFENLKNRKLSEQGVEIWVQHRDWLVVVKEDMRYGKFYPIYKYSYDQLFDVDPVLRCRFHGVRLR